MRIASWMLLAFSSGAFVVGRADAQYVIAGGLTSPSPLPTGVAGWQQLCAGAPIFGLNNTGVPGVAISVYKHWVAVASPERMWGAPPTPPPGGQDLDQHTNFTERVILVIDLDANPPRFWNTGLIGDNPSIFETDEGITIAFETSETWITIPSPPSVVTGYPALAGIPAATDMNCDGDSFDDVIVLYTWESSLPGHPGRGFTRFLVPPCSTSPNHIFFSRPSLTKGFLVCEAGLPCIVDPNPCPAVVREIWVWYLGGLSSPTHPWATHPTQEIYASPPPWYNVIPAGYRPHVSSAMPGTGQTTWVVYEKSESQMGVHLDGDGALVDYGYYRRQILSAAVEVPSNVGHPNVQGGCPTIPCVNPSLIPGVAHPLSTVPGLGDQAPIDIQGKVGNLVTWGFTVPGIPNEGIPNYYIADYGDRSIRRGAGAHGDVMAFSRFDAPPEPGPPAPGPTREDPSWNTHDETIGVFQIGTGAEVFGSAVSALGLYPSIAGSWVGYTTREYALNVNSDLNGDGQYTPIVRRSLIPIPFGLKRPRTVGCGYGPALEDDPQLSVLPGVSLITVFLTPENLGWGSNPPPTGGVCLASGTSLNLNACFANPAYRDMDEEDIVVRWEAH